MKPVETEDLTIHYDVRTCIHARACVLGLPKVFDPDARPWINPENGTTQDIIDVIEACPSGALSYENKAGANEALPKTNTARLWENGPVEIRGDIRIEGHEPRQRMLLCRCGKTANPPFCNNAHRKGFLASGLPDFREDIDKAPEASDGPINVTVFEDGPVEVKGNIEVIGSDGHRIARMTTAYFCRCGSSGDKPFCDGSHKRIGFTKQAKKERNSG